MSVTVDLTLNGARVPVTLDTDALAAIVAALPEVSLPVPGFESPYMSIPEAAKYLRCNRQRIDDLCSQRRLTRYKDGTRTLVSRAEIDAHLNGRSNR